MAKTDDIYKLFIDYIQDDNNWKENLLQRVSSIEYQTKLTNGRMNKIEPIVEDLEKLKNTTAVTKKINWKWLAGILAVVAFLVDIVVNVLLDWIKKHLQ